jgi:hypothetical protein
MDMPKKILNVVTLAHRATIEEQDDTVLWISAVLKGAGSDLAILLRGAAVGSAVKGQDASGLKFGARAQTKPPRIDEDVAKLVAKGVPVLYVEEDARERGIAAGELVGGLQPISRNGLGALYGKYDQVWTW